MKTNQERADVWISINWKFFLTSIPTSAFPCFLQKNYTKFKTTECISHRTGLWVASDSLQSVGKEIKRYQSTSAMTRGSGQNPMARKKKKKALQEPFTTWMTQGFIQNHLLLQACLAGCNGEQRANLLTNGKMTPVGRALARMGCAEHPQLCRRAQTNVKTTSRAKPRADLTREHLTVSAGQRSRKWGGGMWQAILGELNLHFSFF